MKMVSHKWRAPRRKNDRAWKRVEKGEWDWDRRAKRERRTNDTITRYEKRRVEVPLDDEECPHECCNLYRQRYRWERVPGSGKEYTNFNRTPDVDLGG